MPFWTMLVATLVGEDFPYWKKWTAFRKLPRGWGEDKRRTKEAERSTIDIWRRIFSDSIGAAAKIMCILKHCQRPNGQRIRPLQRQETHRITLTNIRKKFDKSIHRLWQLRKIHLPISTNPYNTLEKSLSQLGRIQQFDSIGQTLVRFPDPLANRCFFFKSNFTLVFFALCNKFMLQFWQIHVTTLTNPTYLFNDSKERLNELSTQHQNDMKH